MAEATGHSQYISKYIKRKWYCPFQEVPKEEWLASIKAEEQALAAASTAITNTSTTTVTNTTTAIAVITTAMSESDTDEMY